VEKRYQLYIDFNDGVKVSCRPTMVEELENFKILHYYVEETGHTYIRIDEIRMYTYKEIK